MQPDPDSREARPASTERPPASAGTPVTAAGPGRVFRRSLDPALPLATHASGATVWDADGRSYLDAVGGSVVVGIGHGRVSVAQAMAGQAERLAYVHGSAFTNEPLERYARQLGPMLPLDDPAIFPVAGGSEAVETAIKLARAFHLVRNEPDRHVVISRWGSYHGSTLGALDLSGRTPLRGPYEPWLDRFPHVSAPYPYRAGHAGAHALAGADELADELRRAIQAAGPRRVAAFVAEPIIGATLGAVVPPDDYWPAIADVCRRFGVLLVVDEVMTGFGRTGRWFGIDHWGVRPDILAVAKGTTSGYWPFGIVAASGEVHDVVQPAGFAHGFTNSHHAVGSAVAAEVLRILEAESLVDASRDKGDRLRALLDERLGEHPNVGELRGRGLFAAIELVADRESRRPFRRSGAVAERVARRARDRGVLVYGSTSMADGVDGDAIILAPPFIITDDELERIADVVAEAIVETTERDGTGSLAPAVAAWEAGA